MSVLTGGLLIGAGLVLTFALVQCAMLALARYRPDPELEAQVRGSYERRPTEEAQRECQRRAWTSWQARQALLRQGVHEQTNDSFPSGDSALRTSRSALQ